MLFSFVRPGRRVARHFLSIIMSVAFIGKPCEKVCREDLCKVFANEKITHAVFPGSYKDMRHFFGDSDENRLFIFPTGKFSKFLILYFRNSTVRGQVFTQAVRGDIRVRVNHEPGVCCFCRWQRNPRQSSWHIRNLLRYHQAITAGRGACTEAELLQHIPEEPVHHPPKRQKRGS